MPIRSFEHLIQQHRSCQFTEGTQILQDTRLGIEGLSWLKRILNTYKEPIMTALGGCAAPLGLKNHIVKELEWFKAQRIQPIFVFPGITQTRKSAPFATEDTRPIRRNQGWEYYNKGQRNLALTNWSGNNVVVADLMLSVFDILDENGVEFLRSPYGNLAQLSYFVNHPRGYVHAVWCSTDLLMYNVDKVITSIDFERNSFKFIDKQALLNSLQITDEQFLDICLLAGDPNLITTFPPMSSPGEGSQLSFSWANIMDLIRTYGSGFNIAQAWAEHPTVAKSNYIDTFCRTRASVKHHIILSDDGQIEPLNKEYAPSDMHEVIGYRLPDEIYYYLSVGLISPQVINNLVSGTLIETAPLCNGETEEYRKFLQDLLEVRTQTLGLLTQPLNQYYQTKKVNTSYYFAPTSEHPMLHSSPQYIVSEKLKWHVNKDVIDQDMKTHDSKSVDLLFCVKALKEPKGNKGGKKGEDGKTKPKFESRQEILANVTWKALQLRGLVDQSHALTPLGKAFMHAAAMPVFTQNSTNSPSSFKFYEELFIALELINAGMLNGTEYSRKYDITVRVEDDKEKQHITLITRALSLLNVQLKSVPWMGPVNRDLLCFNSIVKALQRTLRNLFEMLALNMCLNDEVKKDRDDYLKIALSLPFHKDATTALGVIAKSYLEALADSTVNVSSPTSPTHPTAEDKENSSSNGDRAKSKEEVMKMFEAKFDFVKDVREELNRGLTFWNQLVHAVKKLREHKLVTEEVAGQFKAADAWLNTRV